MEFSFILLLNPDLNQEVKMNADTDPHLRGGQRQPIQEWSVVLPTAMLAEFSTRQVSVLLWRKEPKSRASQLALSNISAIDLPVFMSKKAGSSSLKRVYSSLYSSDLLGFDLDAWMPYRISVQKTGSGIRICF